MKPYLTPWLSVDGMRAADRYMMETLGLGERALMETAVRGAFAVLEREVRPLGGMRIGVVCGRGGNAGDGLGLARYAVQAGACAEVWLAADPARFQGATAQQWNALREIERLYPGAVTWHQADIPPETPRTYDLLIDALLGTGLSRPLSEAHAGWVSWMNATLGRRIAVDIPSGLDAQTGRPMPVAVEAELTLTMGARKVGMALPESSRWTGEVHVIDLGFPPALVDELARSRGGMRSAHAAWVRAVWPRREATAHKYTAGTVLVVGGSATYSGAPVLTSLAAARAGAGYVMLSVPEEIRDVARGHLVDIPVLPFPTEASLPELLRKPRALVVGPGLEDGPHLDVLLEGLARHFSGPVVIDAGALSAWARVRPQTSAPWVLTPHAGEWGRISGGKEPSPFAREFGVAVVLKGPCTHVYVPAGDVYCAPSHPLLATAGTGDVLAGVMASTLAQGLSLPEALLAPLFITRQTAEDLNRHRGSVLASDLMALLPQALSSLLA